MQKENQFNFSDKKIENQLNLKTSESPPQIQEKNISEDFTNFPNKNSLSSDNEKSENKKDDKDSQGKLFEKETEALYREIKYNMSSAILDKFYTHINKNLEKYKEKFFTKKIIKTLKFIDEFIKENLMHTKNLYNLFLYYKNILTFALSDSNFSEAYKKYFNYSQDDIKHYVEKLDKKLKEIIESQIKNKKQIKNSKTRMKAFNKKIKETEINNFNDSFVEINKNYLYCEGIPLKKENNVFNNSIQDFQKFYLQNLTKVENNENCNDSTVDCKDWKKN